MIINSLYIENYRRFRNVDLTFESSHGLIVFCGKPGSGKTSILNSIFMGLTNKSLLNLEYEFHHSSVDENNDQKVVVQVHLANKTGPANVRMEMNYSKCITGSWKKKNCSYEVEPVSFFRDVNECLMEPFICLNDDLLYKLKSVTQNDNELLFPQITVFNAVLDRCSDALNSITSNTELDNISCRDSEKAAYLKSLIRGIGEFSGEEKKKLLELITVNFWKYMDVFGMRQIIDSLPENHQMLDLVSNHACLGESKYILCCLSFFLAQRDVVYSEFEIEPFPIILDCFLDRVDSNMKNKVYDYLNSREEQVFVSAYTGYESNWEMFETYYIEDIDDYTSIVYKRIV